MNDDFMYECGNYSLFAPHSLEDVRERLEYIEKAGCPCPESDHMNALHDLAHDDVPALIRVIEAQDRVLRQIQDLVTKHPLNHAWASTRNQDIAVLLNQLGAGIEIPPPPAYPCNRCNA